MEIKLTPTRDSDNTNTEGSAVCLSAYYSCNERVLSIKLDNGRTLDFTGSDFAKALRALDVKE